MAKSKGVRQFELRQFWVKAYSWMNPHFLVTRIWEQGESGGALAQPECARGDIQAKDATPDSVCTLP